MPLEKAVTRHHNRGCTRTEECWVQSRPAVFDFIWQLWGVKECPESELDLLTSTIVIHQDVDGDGTVDKATEGTTKIGLSTAVSPVISAGEEEVQDNVALRRSLTGAGAGGADGEGVGEREREEEKDTERGVEEEEEGKRGGDKGFLLEQEA